MERESCRPSPTRELEIQEKRDYQPRGIEARESYPASSSTDAPSYHMTGSSSESAPSVQAHLSSLPLVTVPSPSQSHSTTHEPAFQSTLPVSDLSWCKRGAKPITMPRPAFAHEGHTDLVYTMCQTQKFLLSGSRDQSIRVWDLIEQRLAYQPLKGHNSSVHSIVTDEESDIIVSCGGNGSIIVWQLSTGSMKNTFLEAHSAGILKLKLNAKHLVSASKDFTAKVWNRPLIDNPKYRRASEPFPQCVLRDHTAPVNDIVLTEFEIITACGDRLIRVFEIDGGTLIRKMGSHTKTVVALALSSDHAWIFSAGSEGDIVIHQKSSGQAVSRLTGHENLIRTLEFIPGCNLLLSGSYDETVAIWATNSEGLWKKERTLDVKETQRNLGLDLKERQRSHDFTEMVRTAVENGAEPAAISSGKVFCMLPRLNSMLCGAGCTIVGWSFSDDSEEEEAELQPARTFASSSSHKDDKGKGKGRRLFKGLIKRP
jgi:WD40 repeat protein